MSLRARIVLVAAALVLLGLFSWRASQKRNTGDLAIYYEAGQRLRAGHDLYHERETDQPEHHTGYIYLPPFAVAFAPLSALPFPLARGLWFLVCALFAARAFQLALRLIERAWPPPDRRALALALALGAVISLRAVWNDLGHGQVNLLVIALTLEAVWAAEGRRDRLAGALFGVAVVLKVVPALLLVPYLLARRWRLCGTATGVGLALLLLPSLVLGFETNLRSIATFALEVTPWHAQHAAGIPFNVTPSGAIYRWLAGYTVSFGDPHQTLGLALDPAAVRAGCNLLSLTLFAGALTWAARTWGDDAVTGEPPPPQRVRILAALCAAVPLISPVAWKPHLVWLILPGLLTGRLLLVRGRHRPLLVAAWGLTVLTGRFPFGKAAANLTYLWGLPALGLVCLFAGLLLAPSPEPEPAPESPSL